MPTAHCRCRVTLHCLATYGARVGSASAALNAAEFEDGAAAAMEVEEQAGGSGAGARASGGNGCYALDEAAVCLHFARSLLQAQPDWELHDFEREWQQRVPEVGGAAVGGGG